MKNLGTAAFLVAAVVFVALGHPGLAGWCVFGAFMALES